MTAVRFVLTSLTAAALAALGGHAMALGLGRISVLSSLGEPLRAEIDVTSLQPEEAATLQLRIASPEAYRAAGVEYSAALSAAQLTLARRSDGSAYMRLTSDRAVAEPFIDVILEMTWATGRLVREYTLLVDPPRTTVAATPAAPGAAPVVASTPPVAPRPAPAAVPAPVPSPPRAAAVEPKAASAPAVRRPSPTRTAVAPKPAAPSAAPAAGAEVRVRSGDTLYGIATRTQPNGVSLDQMLVSLFRGNPQAFVANNMNRLRAGAVLTLPSAEDAGSIPAAQARQMIVAQSADFNAYRRKLAAGVPMAREAPARQATGQVQAAVEDRKQAASPTPDKLKLSQGAVKSATAPEAKISSDAAAKEAATRVAELARNVEDLKKLQESSTTVAAASPAAKPGPATAAPAPAPTPASAAAPATLPMPAPVVVPAPAPAPMPPAAAASAPAAPVASAPAPAPKTAGPAPAGEPGFVDSLLASPFLLPGAGILALVLAGVGVYRVRGRNRKAGGETSFLESRLQPDSFFGASGGQRIDTHDAGGASLSSANSSSMGYSLSQLDAIGDVDPVAEADVYLAYGRDLQAEEILKEAMRSTPERLAIRTKLLEVYAKRRDTKGFELLATQLFALTKGLGEEWTKAQEMGRSIDPDNTLYHPGGEPDAVVQNGDRFIEPLGASTLPQSVMPSPSGFPTSAGALSTETPAEQTVDLDLDLDLGFGPAESPVDDTPSLPEQTMPFAPSVSALPPADAPAMPDMPDLQDINAMGAFNEPRAGGDALPAASTAEGLDFDLGDISLDFDASPAETPASAVHVDAQPSKRDSSFSDFELPEGPDSRFNEVGDPLERKVELADEFRQIGDVEGARDLLEEVIAQADGALKAKAKNMLDSLG